MLEPMEGNPQPQYFPDVGVRSDYLSLPVVAILGHPENRQLSPNLPRVIITTTALRSLNDLMSMAVTPGEGETGIRKEFGYGAIGIDFPNNQGIVISYFIPAPTNIPSEVTAKSFTPEFLAHIYRCADTNNLDLVATGHDHHEVASNAPSGIDHRVLNNPKRLEFISRSTRDPATFAIWRWNAQAGDYVHVPGIDIINTDSTSQTEIDALVSRFGYAGVDGVTITHIKDGRAVEGHVDKVAPRKLSAPPINTITLDLGEGEGGDHINIEMSDLGEGEGGDTQYVNFSIEEADLDGLSTLQVQEIRGLKKLWLRLIGNI